jgi:hypothetical protein
MDAKPETARKASTKQVFIDSFKSRLAHQRSASFERRLPILLLYFSGLNISTVPLHRRAGGLFANSHFI